MRPDAGRLPAAVPVAANAPAGAMASALAGSAARTAGFPATDSLPSIAARVAGPVLSPVPALLAGQPVAADVPSRPTAPIYRLSILLVGAAELSAVHLARLMPPGQSVGLQAEYRLGARLRVSTGLLRTNQIFDVRGADYHLPAGTAAPGATLQWVAGTAQVLDIPLNLRYDLLARPRSGWFASAGLSSVLMRGEHYRYDYLVNGQPEEQEASQVNGSRHPFSTLNLSIGYERALGLGPWSAQVEPFVKLPLRGVGMGQAMVSSIGVQLGIKYGLLPVRTLARH